MAFRVRIEVATMGSDAFIALTMIVNGRDADEAQDRAIAHVERTGRCHRHVLSVTRLRPVAERETA